MNRFAAFLFVALSALSAQAATWYVASTGNDSNPGSSGSPFLTLQKAFDSLSSGDTVVIVANGSGVNCNVSIAASRTIRNITVQSSALANLPSSGTRVDPVRDAAALAECRFNASQTISLQAEVHGFNQVTAFQSISESSSTFTITSSNDFTSNGIAFANGSMVDFEINNQQNGDVIPPNTVAVPSPLVQGTHYWVVNCSVSPACGLQNSTFQVAATSGGSPITITACDASCQAYTQVGAGISVNTSTGTFTSPTTISGWANGTPIAFGTAGLQLNFAAPAPLSEDQIVYVVNLSGNTFKVAATPGGSALSITDTGTGIISAGNTNVPTGITFRGIDFAPNSGQLVFNLLEIGSGFETSQYGMVSHVEVDRCAFHDFSATDQGPIRDIAENGRYVWIHDSWIGGAKSNFTDSQAIGGWGSLGPTLIENNFIEAAAENLLYGGNYVTYYPLANANKTIRGNYIYKPFSWKTASATASPSGSCQSDNSVDPLHPGGEWYLDTMTSQQYQCVAGSWSTTASTPPNWGVKNLYEHKNGQGITLSGNILQGSWTNQQAGQAFTFGQAEGSGPGFANDHIAVMNNLVTQAYWFLSGGSRCTGLFGSGSPGVLPCRVTPSVHTFRNNLATLGGTGFCGVSFTTAACGTNIFTALWNPYISTPAEIWLFNTIVTPDGITGSPYFPDSAYWDDELNPGNVLFNNALNQNSIRSYDLCGSHGCGDPEFTALFTNSLVSRIAFIGATGTYGVSPGATNTVNNIAKPADTPTVAFVSATGNALTGNYHLGATSPYSASNGSATLLSSLGTDLGADVDIVNQATATVVSGAPTWNSSLAVLPASTKLLLSYNAPSAAACTATIYSAPARISGNQVASVADSSASSVSDSTARQLMVTGLTASTHYWAKLVCGSGVPDIFDFWTKPAGSGTYQFTFSLPSSQAAKYCTDAALTTGCTTLGAASKQVVPVASGGAIYAQMGGGSVQALIAP